MKEEKKIQGTVEAKRLRSVLFIIIIAAASGSFLGTL
jgi:hypothetical protein